MTTVFSEMGYILNKIVGACQRVHFIKPISIQEYIRLKPAL